MLKSKLFKKYLLIGAGISFIFFIIGVSTNHFLMTIEKEAHFQMMKEQRESGTFPGPRGPRHLRGEHRPGFGPPPHIGNGPPPPPPFERGPKHRSRLYKMFSIQILAILLSVGLTIFVILFHFKGRTRDIESILERIKNGDLKARMPESGGDEFGMAMGQFNIMADEIEELVNRLRDTEATRRILLSELAHDIRTPLASVMNLLELLKGDKRERLSQEQQTDLVEMSFKEVSYISRLVEDLLFLGKIEEPSYRRQDSLIALNDIALEVAMNTSVRYPNVKFDIIENGRTQVNMDPMLASRLLRNLLDNAFSFASNNVILKLYEENKFVHIDVIDDGPGLSLEGIQNYGKKKFSRQEVLESVNQKRISIGLGTVILCAIVKSYHGEVEVYNNKDDEIGQKGATVSIKLPIK